MILWVTLALVALAQDPSLEASFEAQTLQLQAQVGGYGVVRGDRQLSADEFAGIVGDAQGLGLVRLAERRQDRTAVATMGGAALLIGAGSWLMASGLARNSGELRGEGPARQVLAGGVTALAGVGAYGVTATVMMGRGGRSGRVDQHYSEDQALAWMERYHGDLAARLVEAAE